MKIREVKKTSDLKNIVFLQFVIMIYSISSVIAKFASKQSFMSVKFIGLYFFELVALGAYAILWQQAIKHFQLSVAYVNKAMTLLWAMVWSLVIFGEKLTMHNVMGVVFVIAGIIVINSENENKSGVAE